jgi:manganese transport system substrate-binding protein
MPKRTTARFASAVATLALSVGVITGCSPAAPEAADADDRPFVLATFTVLADLARNVAGDHVRVESLTRPGTEIHGYEPTPSDLVRASGADLVLENGLGLEAWFQPFIDQVGAPAVTVTEGIEALPIASDTAAGAPNPHAWMSPRAAQDYVSTIAEALSDLAPEHAASFAANAEAYREQLDALHEEMVSSLAALPAEQRALVTCEGAFSYLARDAGLTEHYIWPVNAEQQATPQRLASTIEFVERNDVTAVFCESTVSDDPMQQVVEATGAAFGGTLYVDSLSQADGPVPTYLDLIRHTVRTITTALTAQPS